MEDLQAKQLKNYTAKDRCLVPERKLMGLKQTSPGIWAYDVHERGISERPRGVFKGNYYEAKRFYDNLKNELRNQKKSSLTFKKVEDVLERYRVDKYQHTARYKKSQCLYNTVKQGIGFYPLKIFDLHHFTAWIEKKKNDPFKDKKVYKPDTLNAFIVLAKAAFNHCVNNYDLPSNPIKNAALFEPMNRQYWAYSQSDVMAVLSRAKESPYYRVFLALKYLPCRISELLNLTGADIRDGYIWIRDDKSKTQKGRTLPIPFDLRKDFDSIPKECPHVFCTAFGKSIVKRSRMDCKNILRWLKAQARTLNLPGATLHGFRRTCTVRLYDAGVELPTIQAMTGHSDLSTLIDRYLPISQRHTFEAMQKLEAHLSVDKVVDKTVQQVKVA